MRALLVLMLVLALTAPAAARAPTPTFPGSEPDESIRDGSAQRKLDRARERWRRADIHNYRFKLTRQCFCPPESKVLFVRGDKVLGSPGTLTDVATVRRLHRRIQDAIDGKVAGLSVRYDKRGMPRSIGLDPIGNAIDDEVGYEVEKFWRGTRGRGGPER